LYHRAVGAAGVAGEGHVYDTAIVNLEQKQVIGVGSGHRQREMTDFFTALPHAEDARVVVMDMHEPFKQAVALCLPQASVVVGKFHVLLHSNRALDRVRTGIEPRQGKHGELFRSRYLLLKEQERLAPVSRAWLVALLRRYPQLHHAWLLKESFKAWHPCTSRQEAKARLIQRKRSARDEGYPPFRGLFPMLHLWRQEILNYFDYPYTNGFLEGKRIRIKVIKRVAYGHPQPRQLQTENPAHQQTAGSAHFCMRSIALIDAEPTSEVIGISPKSLSQANIQLLLRRFESPSISW